MCLEEENEIPQTGNSTVVQWIGLHIFTAKGLDSIPGWGTKILQAMPHSTSSPPSPKRIPQIWDSCSKRHMCSYVCSTRMYLYALTFTIAKTWKQPKCLTTEKWIEAMWCVCTQTHTHTRMYIMDYYSAIKRNEIMPSAAIQMDLEITISEAKSDRERRISYDITHMWNLIFNSDTNKHLHNRNRLTDTENKLIVTEG